MENARYIVKVVVVPLVIACLIPVFYRAGVSFLSSDSSSVTKTMKGLEKRLVKLEQESTASVKRANDIETSYNVLKEKLELVESILHQTSVESLENAEQIATDPDKLTIRPVDKNADTGWAVPIGLSVLQIVFLLVNIVLCVRLKKLGTPNDRQRDTSVAVKENTPRKNEQA